MGAWSEYRVRGLWGLWLAQFPDGFDLSLSYSSYAYSLSSRSGALSFEVVVGREPVFEWVSDSGLSLSLYGSNSVPVQVADFWSALLFAESMGVDGSPTFMPFVPAADELGQGLNGLLQSPPPVVVFNGQPGTGKAVLLQSLLLRHAGWVLPAENEALMTVQVYGQPAVIVPEFALLEVEHQQAILKHVKGGGRLWGATVYDLAMLKSRKILQAALADALISARVVLPPVAKREAAGIEEVSAFWSAFYGARAGGPEANLDFHKNRILGKSALSVESILEEGRGLRGVIAEFEKEAILKAQGRVGRSQHKIANLLKVSRGSLQHKLRKYQLESYASPDADTDTEG